MPRREAGGRVGGAMPPEVKAHPMSSRFRNTLTREVWSKIGYGVSAAWMMGVLFYTKGDTSHSFFQYIFIVPLTGWLAVLALGAAIKWLRRRSD